MDAHSSLQFESIDFIIMYNLKSLLKIHYVNDLFYQIILCCIYTFQNDSTREPSTSFMTDGNSVRCISINCVNTFGF